VDSKEIRIEYCPTGEMLADFFTKPLQGRQFYELRDQVMNIDPNSKYHSDRRSVLSAKSEVTDDVAKAMDVKTTTATEVEEGSTGVDEGSKMTDVVRPSSRDAVFAGHSDSP